MATKPSPKPKRGRPVGWRKPDAYDGRLDVRLKSDDLARLAVLAADRDQSTAEYARGILERSLARSPPTPAKAVKPTTPRRDRVIRFSRSEQMEMLGHVAKSRS